MARKWYITNPLRSGFVYRDGKWVSSREQDPTWFDTEGEVMAVLCRLSGMHFRPIATFIETAK